MEIKGLQRINLLGIILFVIIGCLIALRFNFEDDSSSQSTYYIQLFIRILWLSVVLIIASLLIKNTVLGLGQGKYETAKRWTQIGIIFGFAGGPIPAVIFIYSYISIDDVIKPKRIIYPTPQTPVQPPPIKPINK
jgi:hypothetical protein